MVNHHFAPPVGRIVLELFSKHRTWGSAEDGVFDETKLGWNIYWIFWPYNDQGKTLDLVCAILTPSFFVSWQCNALKEMWPSWKHISDGWKNYCTSCECLRIFGCYRRGTSLFKITNHRVKQVLFPPSCLVHHELEHVWTSAVMIKGIYCKWGIRQYLLGGSHKKLYPPFFPINCRVQNHQVSL